MYLIGVLSRCTSLAVPAFLSWTEMATSAVTQFASAVREFIAPRYKPELYYMRGQGPACARRTMNVGGGKSRQ
jgi:hypothetical protein